jgi:hypothetical protein
MIGGFGGMLSMRMKAGPAGALAWQHTCDFGAALPHSAALKA